MDELIKEIVSLRDQIQRSVITGKSVERQALEYLDCLIMADEKTFNLAFADLKEFWLSSVDWCSELSKQLEKLVIIQEES